jgi:ABC-type branched-subunit amino acid transport system permease subunit
VGAALVLLGLVSLPAWGDPSTMRIVVEFIALLVLAQMWNLLAGYAGLVSIGQQAYVGLGGYALIVLADDLGVNPFVSVPLAGVVAAAFALPTAALVFRFHGGYFAVGTWAIAEVYRLLIANTPALGRGSGRTLRAVFPLSRLDGAGRAGGKVRLTERDDRRGLNPGNTPGDGGSGVAERVFRQPSAGAVRLKRKRPLATPIQTCHDA